MPTSPWPFSPPIEPMLARSRDDLPEPTSKAPWTYEPKWDGFRALAWSDDVRLDSRTGKPLLRYFPELEPALLALPRGTVLDGEVLVVRDGRTDFDALQLRIHPARSRITLLAEELPAVLVAFDVLAHEGEDLRDRPLAERRRRLVALVDALPPPWHLTPATEDPDTARRWFVDYEAAGCDGIIAKRTDQPYRPGKRDWVKWKHRRTLDAVVGGYRLHKLGDRVGSLLLGLYDEDGRLHFVGHCSGFSDADRVALLETLRTLEDEDAFGEDVRRPGAESRWSAGKDLSWIPLRPELVVEVSYDQVTSGRLRHAARFERWRLDKAPMACTMDQLARPPGATFDEVVAGT